MKKLMRIFPKFSDLDDLHPTDVEPVQWNV